MMRRSTVSHHDVEPPPSPSSSTSTTNPSTDSHSNPKRSLEDYGFSSVSSSSVQSKRRRHLSPQNSNIDVKCEVTEPTVSPILRKTTRSKGKLNSSIDDHDEYSTPRKSSSRHANNSSQQMNELTLPNWERICPNIDQILSSNHTQSGVFAHEVQLVQQELEALLSMSIVRETILKDFQHSSTSNADNLRSKILKHQEAERFYSSKKLSKKGTSNASAQKNPQTSTPFVLDRQVTIAPIVGARIDRIWSDVDEYLCQISSNDITTIEDLVEFHEDFRTKLERISQTNPTDSSTLIDELNSMNFQTFRSFLDSPSVLSHYLDRTTLGCFQKKLYEQIGRTSPVYRTPISSPMHNRLLPASSTGNEMANSLRISPRLHPKIDEQETLKPKRKGKFIPSPTSAMKFQQRLQFVQNYLVDQHLNEFETVKRQLFTSDGPKSSTTKKRATTTTTMPSETSSTTEQFQKKFSTLVSLVKECHLISSTALTRAKLQRQQEEYREKLQKIEEDIRSIVDKVETPQSSTSNGSKSSNEKTFQTLKQLLNEWQKIDEQYQDVTKRLSPCDP